MLDLRNLIFAHARVIYNAPTGFTSKMIKSARDPERRGQDQTSRWKATLKGLVDRIDRIRRDLRKEIEALNGKPGSWKHLTTQKGMFWFSGLTKAQCQYLADKKHIYVYLNGRVNISALADSKIEYMAESILEACKNA